MKLVKEISKTDLKSEISDKEADEAFIKILKYIGEDPSREGLLETPKRVRKAFKEYFKGYHEAPIIGIAHVAYIPNQRVVGLSKLARVVEAYSKRLQTQERLTMQIAKTVMEALDAKGVAVTIDSNHMCMTMRGVKKEQATTVTNYYLGQFKEDLSYQNRYLRFISK